MKALSLISLTIAMIFSGSLALALPLGSKIHAPLMQSHPLNNDEGYNFDGIVALDNCSGSIVRFENSRDTDRAMVLTNGHCYEEGFTDPGKFVSGVASTRGFTVLDPDANSVGKITADLVIYSTMTGTDMTLYRTTETYADILSKFHAHALTLASSHPKLTDKIEVISGYWQKGYQCSIDNFIHQLHEDQWTWTDSIRYSRPGCETIGGTSGSPIVLSGTRTVIGVNNTGNDSGEKCTMDNPCEIDENGNVSYQKGLSYGQQTYWLYTCLNANNEVDLSTPGCLLQH